MQEDFIKIYDKHSEAIFRYCYFRVYNREKARDLTQETFMKAWDYISRTGKNIENLTAFLYKIAKNLIIDEFKKTAKQTVSLDDLKEKGFEVSEEPLDQTKSNIDNQNVTIFLNQLEDKYREVLWLRYFSDLSVSEIAHVLKENENNISVRIHRALSKLRNLMPKE